MSILHIAPRTRGEHILLQLAVIIYYSCTTTLYITAEHWTQFWILQLNTTLYTTAEHRTHCILQWTQLYIQQLNTALYTIAEHWTQLCILQLYTTLYTTAEHNFLCYSWRQNTLCTISCTQLYILQLYTTVNTIAEQWTQHYLPQRNIEHTV